QRLTGRDTLSYRNGKRNPLKASASVDVAGVGHSGRSRAEEQIKILRPVERRYRASGNRTGHALRSARRGGHKDKPGNAFRVVDRELLRDNAAHREPDDGWATEVQSRDEAGHVVGHLSH